MKALRLLEQGEPGRWDVAEVPEPEPASDEVVVEVKSCGLNHLDLWLEKGALPVKVALPRIPGGEVAGVVVCAGNEAKDWRAGDRVAVQSNLFCGQCEFCSRGDESLCLHGELLGVQKDGGFAARVKVPARALVRLPEDLSFESSAALTLAGSTAMHMLTDRAQVKRGDWVLAVAGASGVGSAAIQIARELGARVISTGSTPAKRHLAQQLGAEAVLDSTQADWPREVRQLTNKRGVDLVIEHVGGRFLKQCFDCLARGGTVVTCGATAGAIVEFNLWPFFVKQQRLIGSYGRNRADMKKTLDWAARGKIQPVIDSTWPLENAVGGINKLRERKAEGKILINPGPKNGPA